MIASNATISQACLELKTKRVSFLPVYHSNPQNIVSIVYLSDLFSVDRENKILDISKPPWFVTQDTSVLQILEQFRRNNQTIAVILDTGGRACGVLSLDQIADAIFGPEQSLSVETERGGLYVQRTISGLLTVEQFNRDFQVNLPFQPGDTLSDLIVAKLNHPPTRGESVEIGSYEFTVLEPTIRGVKILAVKTIESY
jgi:CBS domain containing-hemolysin-like protein